MHLTYASYSRRHNEDKAWRCSHSVVLGSTYTSRNNYFGGNASKQRPFHGSKRGRRRVRILKANSKEKEQAIELLKHFLSVVGQGESELRQL
jgi:hypothetical protein